MTTKVEHRDIPGFPGYRVGDDGSVWSRWGKGCNGVMGSRWRRLRGRADKDGYRKVNLRRCGKVHERKVHRLVLEAFVGRCPEGMQCRHFPDRDPGNNRLENLAWGTPRENMADQVVHGTGNRGSKHWSAKLTEAQVRIIRRWLAAGISQVNISLFFGVAPQTIGDISTGETWACVP